MSDWKGHAPEIIKDKQPHRHSTNGSYYATAKERQDRRFEIGDRLIMDHKVWEIYEIHRGCAHIGEGFARLTMRPLHETFWAGVHEEDISHECISPNAKESAEEYVDDYGVEIGESVQVGSGIHRYSVDPFTACQLESAVEVTAATECWHESAWEERPQVKDISAWVERHKEELDKLRLSFNEELGVDKFFCLSHHQTFTVVAEDPARVEEQK